VEWVEVIPLERVAEVYGPELELFTEKR